MDRQVFKRGIEIKAHRRGLGRSLVLLLCLAAPIAAAGAADPPGLRAEAAMQIQVRIPPILRMRLLQATPASAEVEVAANLRAFELRFEVDDPDVVAVEIDGLGAPLVVGREGGLYRVQRRAPGMQLTRFALGYRVRYADGGQRSPARVPLRVSAHVP